MEFAEMRSKIAAMKADIDLMLAQPDLEPCYKCGLESVQAHMQLLCNEFALDIE